MIEVLLLILLSSNLAELKAVERVFLDPGIDPLSDEMVNAINSLNTTWKVICFNENILCLFQLICLLENTLIPESPVVCIKCFIVI